MAESKADVLIAWLHDPPDKAVMIRGHEGRARRYLAEALGRTVSESELKGGHEDPFASVAERLPLPSPGHNYERAVAVENGALTVYHPLSAEPRTLDKLGDVDEDGVLRVIRQIVELHEGVDERFFALWRLLPERLSDVASWYGSLPADTRVPDHTIWHHLDITAGLQAALGDSQGGGLLLLSIGPVQPFIAAAQSVRDLWSGSMILSYMAFRAMLPIVDRFGPTAVVFPALRGMPMLDHWLRSEKHLTDVVEPDSGARKSPCLPNRFLAVVPYGPQGETANKILQQCVDSARAAWRNLASGVRSLLVKAWENNNVDAAWDHRWDEQIESFFDIRGAVTPLRQVDDKTIGELLGGELKAIAPDVAAVRTLAEAIPEADRPGYPQDNAGRWQLQNEVAVRLLKAQRSVRHVPAHTKPAADAQYPQKCSLMGSFEQMGPAEREKAGRFWEYAQQHPVDGIWLRDQERLCAVALTKRFAPIVLAKELGLESKELRYYDTATVAAAEWLDRAKERGLETQSDDGRDCSFDYTSFSGWNGQWLHWTGGKADKEEGPPPDLLEKIRVLRHPSKLGPAPLYYAVLMIDGDQMGEWLAGRKSPSVGKVLHPKLREYFEGLAQSSAAEQAARVSAGLAACRPLGPARHAAISEALANFALHVVPQVVADHQGTLIYAGGDDVLALLPCRQAPGCARKLALAFSGDPAVNHGAPRGYYRVNAGPSGGSRDLLMMGPTATVSAGIAVVHYKEDLRLALDAARRAEKGVKQSGRNAAQLAICRRSGEHSAALCPWDFVEPFQALLEAFCQAASDRWAYHLRRDEPTLKGDQIPKELIEAEIRRQVGRAEDGTRRKLAKALGVVTDGENEVGGKIADLFDQYHQRLLGRGLKQPEALRGFITLCQSASFIARGGRET